MKQALPMIRPAQVTDLPAITEILNYNVLTSTCIWQLDPFTPADRRQWFDAHTGRHPIIVAEVDGQVAAWGSLSPLMTRQAWANTVEDSIYVHKDFVRRGLGRMILSELISLGRTHQHRLIVAIISADQTASLKLHESLGFTYAGKLTQAGHKFGQWLDAIYMEKPLEAPPPRAVEDNR